MAIILTCSGSIGYSATIPADRLPRINSFAIVDNEGEQYLAATDHGLLHSDDHGTPPVNRYIVPVIEFADLNLRIPGLRILSGWCEAPRDYQHTAMYRESYPEPVPDLRHRNSRVIDPCQYSDSLMV